MAYELKDIPDDIIKVSNMIIELIPHYGALINNCGHESITP